MPLLQHCHHKDQDKDSQGHEGQTSQKQLFWPSGEEEKEKEKTLVSSSKALTRFSSL